MAGETHSTRLTGAIILLLLMSSGLLERPGNAVLLPQPTSRPLPRMTASHLSSLINLHLSQEKTTGWKRVSKSPHHCHDQAAWILPSILLRMNHLILVGDGPTRSSCSRTSYWHLSSFPLQIGMSVYLPIEKSPPLTTHTPSAAALQPCSLFSKSPWKSFLADCLQFLSSHSCFF